MRFRLRSAIAMVALAAITAITLAACSSDDNPAAPGGGGSGGGPNFNFTFTGSPETHAATFPNAGSFQYQCNTHGTMTGVVTVATGNPDTATVQVGLGGNVFVPSTVTIAPGGTVTWIRASGSLGNHTASR